MNEAMLEWYVKEMLKKVIELNKGQEKMNKKIDKIIGENKDGKKK